MPTELQLHPRRGEAGQSEIYNYHQFDGSILDMSSCDYSWKYVRCPFEFPLLGWPSFLIYIEKYQ